MTKPGFVRRVVTGHDATGKAIVIEDGPAPVVHTIPNRPNYWITQIWMTDASPVPIDSVTADPTSRPLRIEPTDHGTVIRVVEFPPEADFIKNFDARAAKASFTAFGSGSASTVREGSLHPLMHRTETLDYGIVLSGEICMVLDDSVTTLKAGDVVVQRGTNHAWSNRSSAPCKMAFILIDGAFDPKLKSLFL